MSLFVVRRATPGVIVVWHLVLGAAWCARHDPKLSMLPMLGFAFGGVVLVVLMVMSSFRMTRSF